MPNTRAQIRDGFVTVRTVWPKNLHVIDRTRQTSFGRADSSDSLAKLGLGRDWRVLLAGNRPPWKRQAGARFTIGRDCRAPRDGLVTVGLGPLAGFFRPLIGIVQTLERFSPRGPGQWYTLGCEEIGKRHAHSRRGDDDLRAGSTAESRAPSTADL